MTPKTYDPDEYGKREWPNGEKECADLLTELAELAATAGVDLPGLDEAQERVSRANEIQTQFLAERENPDAAKARVAAGLVDGTLTFEEAAQELALAEVKRPGGLMAKAVAMTRTAAPVRSWSVFAGNLDGQAIFEQARESAHDARDAIHKLRKQLDGIRSADHAAAGGSKKAAAWSTYAHDLLPRYDAAQLLVARLRALHIVEPLPYADRHCAQLKRPDLATEANRDAKRAERPILRLLDPLTDAFGPGLYTASEAAQWTDETAQAQREADADWEASRAHYNQMVPGADKRKRRRKHAFVGG